MAVSSQFAFSIGKQLEPSVLSVERGRSGTPAAISCEWSDRRERVFFRNSQRAVRSMRWCSSLLQKELSYQIGNPASTTNWSACFSSEGRSLTTHPSAARCYPRRRMNDFMQCGKARWRVAAAREGEEEPSETARKKWSLEQLDEQLRVLQSRESAASKRASDERADEDSAADGTGPPLQWPEFSTSFFVYTGIGLMLLTVVNNVLYKIFLGPPVYDKRQPFVTSVPYVPRFRVTSLEQEREAREAREAQRVELAGQSKEAPPPKE